MSLGPKFLALLVAAAGAAYSQQDAGSQDCATCHRAIYESYRRTPMALSGAPQGEGIAHETFERAAFTDAKSGYSYRVSVENGTYTLRFDNAAAGVHGAKTLAYAIGSGATARSYLLQDDGFLFEAPVTYYSSSRSWALSPAYSEYGYPYLTRPISPPCLTCHVSRLNPTANAQNRYATPPFGETGISCERCHGTGQEHIARMKTGKVQGGPAILNPAKLNVAARDSVCWQCHLNGEARVFGAGKDWRSYRPGEKLSDSMTVFVHQGSSPGMTVTSHVENLAQSACKRNAGDRLWCGSCHDPHNVPKATEKAAWFRGKCEQCHSANACTATKAARAQAQDNCIGCHMPKSPVKDAQHVVYTDHSIPRRPRPAPAPAAIAPAAAPALVAFDGMVASQRDLALAYAIAAPRETTGVYRGRAVSLLEKVVRESPNDVEALVYLAEIYRNSDKPDLAIPLFRHAIELDAAQVTAPVGLGGILMERGQYAEAIRLWQDALAKNSGLELVRGNLALAQLKMGDVTGARATLQKAIALNPAFTPAVQLLKQMERGQK